LGNGEQQVYLWGTQGSGKSHLLKACCDWRVRHGGDAVHLSLNDAGINGVIDSDRVLDADFVCVDDMEQIAIQPELEALLFNLINRVRAAHGRLVFAGTEPPQALGVLLPDLLSRLNWGPVLRIDPVDDESLITRMKARADAFGMVLNDDAADYILRYFPRDVPTLESLFERLHKEALVERPPALTKRYVGQVIHRMESKD